MSLLIAVKSCNKHRLAGYNQAIRETWGKHAENLVFYQGCFFAKAYDIESHLQFMNDEVPLDCGDSYDDLPEKTRAILVDFLGGNHSHIFLCDTDTFVVPSKLRKTGFEKYDISGRYGTIWPLGTTKNIFDDRGKYRVDAHPWPSGGVGYFLSRKAAMAVLSTPFKHWAEDYMVGQITGPYIQSGEFKAADLPNFECEASWHFQRRLYNNQVYDLKFGWMKMMQERYGDR